VAYIPLCRVSRGCVVMSEVTVLCDEFFTIIVTWQISSAAILLIYYTLPFMGFSDIAMA